MGEQTDGYRSLDAVPSVAPPEQEYGPALTLEVDGEAFEFRPDGRGGTHYDWLSGPTGGYGFSASPTGGCSLDDHRESIRQLDSSRIEPVHGCHDSVLRTAFLCAASSAQSDAI